MLFFHGLDIVDIRRFDNLYEKYGIKLIKKILSDVEINSLDIKQTNKFTLLRKISNAFAVKEATSKALGTGFSMGINFKNIELKNDSFGKPFIKLNGNAKLRTNFLKGKKKNECFSISISNERNYVVASVNLIFF